jgi:hypothetical protein
MLNLVTDSIVKGRIYPAGAEWQARPYTQAWRQFGDHWPYTTPLRIQEYCEQHGVALNIFDPEQVLPSNTFYAVCLGFFDFSIDYMDLLPKDIMVLLQSSQIKLLFMYHEGDNPIQIKQRLDVLCQLHGLSNHCYVFVSANSSAARLPGFVHFDDFELWYWQRNRDQAATEIHHRPRPYDFTVLCREHKWWRATVMADLWRNHLLDRSLWSYCHAPDDDNDHDCPIEIDRIPQLRYHRSKFLQISPKFCDSLTDQQRNDHSQSPESLFSQSYINVVIESQFDVDNSGGVFLTEKTFKPIKHGQPFFIAGAAGSLQRLRTLGYRTFDSVLDNRYDTERDHTERWCLLLQAIRRAHTLGLDRIFAACLPDIAHNQQLFLQHKKDRLNTVIQQINDQYC